MVGPANPDHSGEEVRPPATAAARRREAEAHALDWAAHNLDAGRLELLRARGLRIFEAPEVETGVKLVRLADGRVDTFHEAEHRPAHGYYVAHARLEQYCLEHGLALAEVDGVMSVQAYGRGEAGDPHRHGRI